MSKMNVKVVEHNSQWSEMFQREAEQIADVLGDNLIQIFHYGSTSVPGLKAKPIIDIMPVVRDLELVNTCREAFGNIGYKMFGDSGVPGRIYMEKGGENRTHHISAYQYDDAKNIINSLAFRDYLRCHPEVCAEYGEIKSKAALKYPTDYRSYCESKRTIVEQIVRDAWLWYWKALPSFKRF